MHSRYRLRESGRFATIRREGRTLVHPYLVMALLPNTQGQSRFGFSVGRRIGKAVKRNRIKRLMREAVRLRIQGEGLSAGYDVVFIARHPIQGASFQDIDQAIGLLLRRAGLVSETP